MCLNRFQYQIFFTQTLKSPDLFQIIDAHLLGTAYEVIINKNET